jgi:hypothetical protein
MNLVSPDLPISVKFNSPQIFMFKADLEQKDYETVKIYLAQGQKENSTEVDIQASKGYKTLKILSNLKIHQGVASYMVIWTPKVIDNIPVEGGDDFFLVVSRPGWWGWFETVIFESGYFAIEPLQSKQFLLQ